MQLRFCCHFRIGFQKETLSKASWDFYLHLNVECRLLRTTEDEEAVS